jgi:hypothetical protein
MGEKKFRDRGGKAVGNKISAAAVWHLMGYASEKRDYRTRDKVIDFDVAGEVRGRTITSPSGTSENPFLPAWIAFLEHGFYRGTFQIVGLSPDAAPRTLVFRSSRGSPQPVQS